MRTGRAGGPTAPEGEEKKGREVCLPPFLPIPPVLAIPPLERESQSELSDALLRTTEVAGERGWLKQSRILGSGCGHGRKERARVHCVEKIEDFADRFDVRAAGEVEHFRHTDVQLLLHVAAAAVHCVARADVLDRRGAGRCVERIDRERARGKIRALPVEVQIAAVDDRNRERRPEQIERRDTEPALDLEHGAQADAVPCIGVRRRPVLDRIVERIVGIDDVRGVQLVDRRANRALRPRQRVGCREVDAFREPAARAEDQRIVGALPIADRGTVARSVRVERRADRRRDASRVRQAARRPLVQTLADVEIASERIDEVDADHRVRCQLVRPAGVGLDLIRHLQQRVDPLAEERRRDARHLVLRRDVVQRLSHAKEGAVGISNARGIVDVEGVAESVSARVGCREEHVGIRVPEVGVDAPPAADDVLAVAFRIEHRADAWLEVVPVVARRLREVIQHFSDGRRQHVELPGLC